MTDSRRSLTRRLRRTFGNAFALAYLALCAALFVWAILVSVTDDSGESMAIIFPLLATAPTSFALFLLPGGLAMVTVVVVLGALVNAAVIGWCARVLRRGGRVDPVS
ncbi:SCO4225 family membrane protein [Streptomyces sp. NPDC048737]|uniref:SCO4225 family membrane protein n=1 Tax=unclassified Streptomyces TaxID=2593676 RepID=UPI00343A97CC